MEDLHRELLRRRQKYLQDNVIMEDGLLKALQEKGVLTPTMVSSIQGVDELDRQMARMLDMIPKRGPEAYEKFMEVLTPDYPWIVENFRDREEDMKSKGSPNLLSELRKNVKECVKDLAKTTRINNAQSKAIEDFLCRHTLTDANFNIKLPNNRLYSIHRQLMSCISISSLDESDQMELKDVFPDNVNLDKIEKEIQLLIHRVHELQHTVDSCYDKLGESNKEKELPDLVYSLRKMYLEREIRVEEAKNQYLNMTRQLRIAKDRERQARVLSTQQEAEKEELSHSLDTLKGKIQKLQEERQRMGMRIAFEGVSQPPAQQPQGHSQPPGTPPTSSKVRSLRHVEDHLKPPDHS